MKAIFISILFLHIIISIKGQSNLVRNPSFEGDFLNGDFPAFQSDLDDDSPQNWHKFGNRGNSEERWFVDTTAWGIQHTNCVNDDSIFNPINAINPWDDGIAGTTLQTPHSGHFFVGYDATSNFFPLEGVEQVFGPCKLNSGTYTISLWATRPYAAYSTAIGTHDRSRVRVFLNESDSQTQLEILDEHVDGANNPSPRLWQPFTDVVDLRLNHPDELEKKYIAIVGINSVNNNLYDYVYIDDVTFFRPCDLANECSPVHGNICPFIDISQPPNPVFRVHNIRNASELEIQITNVLGQSVYSHTTSNPNGIGSFYVSQTDLGNFIASGRYFYTLTVKNLCGGTIRTGEIQVNNGLIDTLASWTDPDSLWTPMPIECCIADLVIKNQTLVGDLRFVAGHSITIGPNVTIPSTSNVYMQAPDSTVIGNIEVQAGGVWEVMLLPCVLKTNPQSLNNSGNSLVQNQVSTENLPKTQEVNIENLNLFPNPANKSTMLSFKLNGQSKIKITIFNNLGILKFEMKTENEIGEGTNEIELSTEGLPAGIYFVNLECDSGSESRKLIVIH